MDALRPGVVSADVYDRVYRLIHEHGYAKMFMDQIGYGVGIRQSEFYPILGKGLPHELKENMVVDVLLPTIYKPHTGGPRITDTVLIKKDGCVRLTDFSTAPVFR